MNRSPIVRTTWLAMLAALGLWAPPAGAEGTDTRAAAPPRRAVHPGQPTIPAGGTLGNGVTQVTFQAPDRMGAAPEAVVDWTPASCTVDNCSLYTLTIGNLGPDTSVVIRLDWGLVTNDYDLFVLKDNGDGTETQVTQSGNGAFNNRFQYEQAVFRPEAGATYHVVVMHFASTPGDNVLGSATLIYAPQITPFRVGPTGHGIAFTPTGLTNTPAGPAPTGKGTFFAKETVRDGEPSIRVDALGNVYAAGIRGVPAGVDVWRFGPNVYCPNWSFHDDEEIVAGRDPSDSGYVWLGQPDGIFQDGAGAPDGGGGDIELAVNEPPAAGGAPILSMVSLTLANITSAMSTDRGDDWTPANAVAATVPLDDRQWIDAYGEKTVYLYYRTLATLTGLVLNKSIDGGVTYATATTLANPLGYTPGYIAVDRTPNPDGSVNIYLSGVSSSELVVWRCVDPNPTGVNTSPIECESYTVDNTTSHGHIFDPIAVDRAGNVYAAWADNTNIYYAYSDDKGATWSQPVQVTDTAVAAMPKFNFFPWITAGDDGRIGIVWYGTHQATNDDDAEWKAYYALVPNARAPQPTVNWLPLSEQYIHKGNLSEGGLAVLDSMLNRNLIDFFQVAHDPRDGAAVVAFAADYNDFDGATYYARQIAGPGLRANAAPTPQACAPLTPFRDPEVLDFPDDAVLNAGTRAPVPDADILNIDFGTERVGNDMFVTADITVKDLLVTPPPGRSYRAYFSVNAQRGLMDTGNEYFVEVTTESGTPAFHLGMKDRNSNGGTFEARTPEDIAADQPAVTFTPGAPGVVHLRVNTKRLTYAVERVVVGDVGGTPLYGKQISAGKSSAPAPGSLVIGLSGRARIATVANSTLVDQTRGGSYVLLPAPVVPLVIPCNDPAVTQWGGWQSRVSEDTAQVAYCQHVGSEWKNDPAKRPHLEVAFPGAASQVRLDYPTGPRGAVIEVFIDGVSRGTLSLYRAGTGNTGSKNLVILSQTYQVTPQSAPHVIRVVHRTDLNSGSRNLAAVVGFVIPEGVTGTAASRDAEVAFTGTVAPGGTASHTIVSGLGTLMVKGVVEPTLEALYDKGALTVELYDPAGLLLARSDGTLAPETVSALAVVPGQYTLKVRNNTNQAVGYRASLLRGQDL